MKNNKSHSFNRSRPANKGRFGSSAPRERDEGHPRKPFHKGTSSSDDRDEDRPRKPFYKGASAPRDRDEDRPPRRSFHKDAPPAKYGNSSSTKSFKRPFRAPRPENKKEEAYKPSDGAVLIWGLHAARAAFLNPKRRISKLWLTEAGEKLFEGTINEAREELLKRPDAKKMEREALDRIAPPNSVHQGIVIETLPLPDVSLNNIIAANPPPNLILLLDQVTDPHNVGAILRSAAAFGAGAIVMTERNAPSATGVLAKSASGALECTPMIHVVNLARALDDLREAGYWCVGLAEEGEKALGDLDLSGRTVLVLGAEGEGLRHLTRQKCDELARLPTQGPIGSLNVSNAAAVALYEAKKQAAKG